MKKYRSLASYIVLLVLIAGLSLTWLNRNNLYDWYRLRSYTPSTQISKIAANVTMTEYAKHLFYINRPSVEDKFNFNQLCPNGGGEQTIVLGCYHSVQRGIYLYSVNDPKLDGVEQVTAAHETLHSAYDRLSVKDREKVDKLLMEYYKNGLKDKRIRETIASYQKTEPKELVNEMHSIFGTEVLKLPQALETYYKKYFKDRQKIVAYAKKYQQTFINNQNLANKYLSQINAIERQIDNLKTQIDSQEISLKSQYQKLNSERKHITDQDAFKNAVDYYNSQVIVYRDLINTYNNLVEQHNGLVAKYQAINIETNQLAKELDSRSATVPSQ